MQHASIIFTAQAFNMLFGIGVLLGVYSLSISNFCVVGGRSFCALDMVLLTFMAGIAFTAFAFFVFLFKAYDEE